MLTPTAEQVRHERDTPARQQRLGVEGAHIPPAPARLLVGLDGGWGPRREQHGGMEGQVGVVATGVESVGSHGRHRLRPRRCVATCATSDDVGALASAAAGRLGGQEAVEHVVLGDGAALERRGSRPRPSGPAPLRWASWTGRLGHGRGPTPVHASRAARPGPAHRARRREWPQALPDQLWHGAVDAPLDALSALRPAPSPPPADPVPGWEDALASLQGQRAWLGHSAAGQAAGSPVGRGVIERAVALVITRRLQRQGRRWGRATAAAVVARRVRRLNADGDHTNWPVLPAA